MKIYGNSDGKPFGESYLCLIKEEDGETSCLYKDGIKEELNVSWAYEFKDRKEIQYPPSWPNAFKYRWEPLSKLPAPKGFVYIGRGGKEENQLKHFFSSQGICEDSLSDMGLSGSLDYIDYYVKKETWDNKFKKEMKTLRVYTQFDKAAEELVRKMAEERGLYYGSDKYWILDVSYSGNTILYTAGNEWADADFKSVPLHEFIHELGKLPVKEKEIVIDILPWKVVVRGEKCDIGCRKDVRVADLRAIIKTLENNIGETELLGEIVYTGKLRFKCEGHFISWETLDKFKAALDEIK